MGCAAVNIVEMTEDISDDCIIILYYLIMTYLTPTSLPSATTTCGPFCRLQSLQPPYAGAASHPSVAAT